MSDDSAALVGQVLDGTYHIVRPLARGGMGAIYEATHARLAGKRYAVKVLHPVFASNEEVFRRFRREAEIATQLGHDHIIEVQDFNVTPDSVAYMVMEFLDGEDLAARIERGPMPLERIVHIVAQVASALGAAHSAGVVHRDLKPQNIFLTRRRGSNEFVKVLDFGISKMQCSSSVITRDQSLMGTPFYMSPEQAMGMVRDVDARTDVFALGAIIWEMLTGQMAFAAETIPGALYKVAHEEPRPVHEIRGDVPPGVSALLARAMAKDRDARVASAQQVAAELEMLVGRTSAPSLGLIATAMSGAMRVDSVHLASVPPSSMVAAPRGSVVAMPHSIVATPGTPSSTRNTPTTMSASAGQLAAPLASSRRLLPWAIIGTGSVLASALVALLVLRRNDAPGSDVRSTPVVEPAPAPEPKPAEPPPAPPQAAEPSLDLVPVRFDIHPAGVDATVRIDGTSIDEREVHRLRSSEALHVTVTAKGYAAWKGEVIPDRERVVAVELVAQRTVRSSKRTKQAVKRAEPRDVAASAAPTPVESVAPPPAAPVQVPAPPPPTPAPAKKHRGTIFDDD